MSKRSSFVPVASTVTVLFAAWATASCSNRAPAPATSAIGTASIVGTWSQKTNGTFCCTVVYSGDGDSLTRGTSSATNGATSINQGTWTSLGNAITTRWTSSIDSLTLSSDGNVYSGSNDQGVVVTAQRTGPGGSGQCVPAPSGLVSWWTGDGDAADFFGTNDGTATGTVTYVPGVVGQAFQFDGRSYVTSSTSGLPVGGADRTIELWGRLDVPYTSPDVQGLFFGYGAWGTGNGTNEALVLGNTTGSNVLVFSPWGSSVSNPTPVSVSTWFHYAYTLAGGASTLYVNGAPVATSSSLALNTPGGSSAYIGAFPDPPQGTEWLSGAVDEVSVYSRALSAGEIAAIYGAGQAGKCKTVNGG